MACGSPNSGDLARRVRRTARTSVKTALRRRWPETVRRRLRLRRGGVCRERCPPARRAPSLFPSCAAHPNPAVPTMQSIFSRVPRRTMLNWRCDVNCRGGWLKIRWTEPREGLLGSRSLNCECVLNRAGGVARARRLFDTTSGHDGMR